MIVWLVMLAITNPLLDNRASRERDYQVIPLTYLSGNPSKWIGIRVEICGEDRTSIANSNRKILMQRFGDESRGVYLDVWLAPSRMKGANVCYKGVWRREDGKTHKEVLRDGAGTLTHGAINPEYFLSPK
jgi:hypothetical protein